MQHISMGLHLLLALLSHHLTPANLEDVDVVQMEVIVDSSPCSTTCGIGVKTETLCLLQDSKTAMEEGVGSKNGTEVTDLCRVRKVSCRRTWQCGLRTMTVTSGQRVEMDCLEEVMEAMGRFSWRVLWRYARGIISSDDSLFARWEAPQLGRVVLDPVHEENAGTYFCEVQDATYHRVKTIYWGVRVLPAEVVNLDYDSALAQWESTGRRQNQTAFPQFERRTNLLHMVLSVAGLTLTGITLLALYCVFRRRALNRSSMNQSVIR